jgi:hypothetical protein
VRQLSGIRSFERIRKLLTRRLPGVSTKTSVWRLGVLAEIRTSNTSQKRQRLKGDVRITLIRIKREIFCKATCM